MPSFVIVLPASIYSIAREKINVTMSKLSLFTSEVVGSDNGLPTASQRATSPRKSAVMAQAASLHPSLERQLGGRCQLPAIFEANKVKRVKVSGFTPAKGRQRA
jgi:hypothetical protein